MRAVYAVLLLGVVAACARPSPTPVPTATPHPDPTPSGAVTGSVDWEGVYTGTFVNIFALSAESTAGEVTQLRRGRSYALTSCAVDPAPDPATVTDWEPYSDSIEEEFLTGGHYDLWLFYVQYRDDVGNVSPYYCVEVVVVNPTPSPIWEPISDTPLPPP